MAIVTVQPGGSIQAAIDAAAAGDTIDVAAGNYGSQFLTVTKSLTLEAIGGPVILAATSDPPNGKAIIDAGGAGLAVNISGFDVSGAVVGDNNGAAVRYEGGTLNLSNVHFHDNQEGLLGAPDPNGSITIDHSEIDHNGDGSGSTHDLYIGQIANFTLTNSYVHDTVEGHEVKSRTATNVITGNRIFDNDSTASYTIDLPNGGNASITGNVIQQGPHTHNPATIAYGEEGSLLPTNVSIASNTIVNDDAASNAIGIWNDTARPLPFTSNSVFGLDAAHLSSGPLAASGTVFLATHPTLDTSAMQFVYPGSTVVTPPPPTTHGHNGHHHQTAVALADFTAPAAHPAVWQEPATSGAVAAATDVTMLAHVLHDFWSSHQG